MTVYYNKFSTDTEHAASTFVRPDLQEDTLVQNRLPTVYRSIFKRLVDCFVVLILAPFAVLIVGVLALLVALDGGNPFYHQLRVGRGGVSYKMWKLRTMVAGADIKLESYLAQNAEAKAEWDSTQKLKTDPRITRIGHILRKYSFDELPQAWNVLMGDMSLVGPRPMMPEQQDLYPGAAYYHLRPGITGPWQVSDRNNTTFAERARFDTNYDLDLSLKTDLRLLLGTARVVVRGTGY